MEHEPFIVGFLCNWCSYRAADYAGTSRMKHTANLRIIRVMCSGRVEPQFVLKAFQQGADGVLIGGCHIGECHYVEGNIRAFQRFSVLQSMLNQFGIDDDRLRLVWTSAAEGKILVEEIDKMVGQLKKLPPLAWKDSSCSLSPEVSP